MKLLVIITISATLHLTTANSCNSSVLRKLQTDIKDLKSSVRKLTVPVAFYASLGNSKAISSLRHHMTLVYDRVDMNYGNDYNKRTGMFTAPSHGMYMFYVTTNACDYSTVTVQLVYNSTVKNVGISDAINIGARLYVTLATPLFMKRGDRVYVRISYLRGKGIIMCSDQRHDKSSFSGFKIK